MGTKPKTLSQVPKSTCLKMYRIIYKDDKTLFDYYKTIENIQLQMGTLESHKTETHTLKLDSINNWLSELLIIWDKSIRLESNLSIDIALDNLIEKLATEKEFQSGE